MLSQLWSYLNSDSIVPSLIFSLIIYVLLEIAFRLLNRIRSIKISAPLAHLTFIFIFILVLLTRTGVATDIFVMQLLRSATMFLAILIVFKILDHLIVESYLEARQKIRVPVLLHELIRIALLLLILFVIISKVFHAKLSTLLVSSAVVSAVIGLALQDVLGNVVAGVALHVGKPFKIGDWVKVSDQVGTVVQTSWRSTTIRTLDGDFVIIPNGAIAKEEIVNFSAPNPRHAEYAQVGARYEVPPNAVKEAMIQAALETEGVLPEPRPRVRLREFGDFSINYKMKYWIDNYPLHPDIRDQVMSHIWYQFRRRGIGIPFPIRDVNLFAITPETQQKERAERVAGIVRALEKVEIFTPLSSQERQRVAEEAEVQRFAAGEDIVRQGEEGDSFFIIKTGEVEVTATDGAGHKGTLAKLGPDAFFGEMSLLTGEKRTATVTALGDIDVIVIDKDGLAGVLQANPAIAQFLSEILERRLKELAAKMAEMEKERFTVMSPAQTRVNLLRRIRIFFRLK